MQWQAHRVKGSSIDNKNIPWTRKRNLEKKFKGFEVLSSFPGLC